MSKGNDPRIALLPQQVRSDFSGERVHIEVGQCLPGCVTGVDCDAFDHSFCRWDNPACEAYAKNYEPAAVWQQSMTVFLAKLATERDLAFVAPSSLADP